MEAAKVMKPVLFGQGSRMNMAKTRFVYYGESELTESDPKKNVSFSLDLSSLKSAIKNSRFIFRNTEIQVEISPF
jgi:hypothetical protein